MLILFSQIGNGMIFPVLSVELGICSSSRYLKPSPGFLEVYINHQLVVIVGYDQA